MNRFCPKWSPMTTRSGALRLVQQTLRLFFGASEHIMTFEKCSAKLSNVGLGFGQNPTKIGTK